MRNTIVLGAMILCACLLLNQPAQSESRSGNPAVSGRNSLHLDTYVAGDEAWNVTSTIIYGKTESILVDSQYFKSDAVKLADRLAATRTRLKAIIITHPHEDHYLGLETIHQRFPDAPIYISAPGLEEFKRYAPQEIATIKKKHPAEAPDSLPTPEVFPATRFLVDGRPVEIMEGHADEPQSPNSYVWLPSLRVVIAGDIIFNHVHAWLGNSNEQSRANWLQSLDALAALNPRTVVGGHKLPTVKDSPDAIAFNAGYIRDFEAVRKSASNADEFIAMMKAKYPNAGQADTLLALTAKRMFRKKS